MSIIRYLCLVCMLLPQWGNAQSSHYSTSVQSKKSEPSVQASAWGLTDRQYQTYLSLMEEGQAKYFWKDLDPVMVLGLSAKNSAERDRYAEQYAKLMRDRVTAELAWSQAFQAADKRLYPLEQAVFDHSVLYPERDSSHFFDRIQSLQAQDVISILVKSDCSSCTRDIKRLLTQVEKHQDIKVDIFFVDVTDKMQLLAWARASKLPKPLFQSKQLTLNLGGHYQEHLGEERLRILIKRSNQLYHLDLHSFSS